MWNRRDDNSNSVLQLDPIQSWSVLIVQSYSRRCPQHSVHLGCDPRGHDLCSSVFGIGVVGREHFFAGDLHSPRLTDEHLNSRPRPLSCYWSSVCSPVAHRYHSADGPVPPNRRPGFSEASRNRRGFLEPTGQPAGDLHAISHPAVSGEIRRIDRQTADRTFRDGYRLRYRTDLYVSMPWRTPRSRSLAGLAALSCPQ
jgi:hypothetical protein